MRKKSACDFFSHSWNFDAISCKKMREYREIAPENDPCFDPVTERRTNTRTNEWKSENYIPPHTSYVGGIIIQPSMKNRPRSAMVDGSGQGASWAFMADACMNFY